MNYVYILQSQRNGQYYIGSTMNIDQRIRQHNAGEVISTKPYKLWKLVLKQEFQSLALARKSEIRLKKLKRSDYIRKIVDGGVIALRSQAPTLSNKIVRKRVGVPTE